MAERAINPILKQVLEFGPTVVLLVLFYRIKENTYVIGEMEYSGFIMATLVFVPVLLIAMGILWYLTRTLSRMQVFTAFMVIFFGGLTAYFNDERFFKMKTTIVWGSLAIVLAIGLMRKQSYLQWMMGEIMPMQTEGWMIFTRRMCGMFVVLAVGNEILWRTQSDEVWVVVETFAFPAILAVFLVAQVFLLQRFLIEPPDDSKT